MLELELLPAVDVKGGQAVQLVQGVDGTEKIFGDPLAAAKRWADAGARWLHLVDLDAAFGHGANTEILSEVAAAMPLQVELSGGIRDDASLERALATGCRRVNIGTAALENPEWCERIIAEHGDRIAIGLDVRNETLAARGWTRDGGDVYETLARMTDAGCERFVVTDVNSDGMLSGPNYELLGNICARTDAAVVASGGISTLEDLRQLRGLVPIGVEGAIVGTALYVGNFSLTDALAVCRGEDPTSPHEPAGTDPADHDQARDIPGEGEPRR
ncbi:bifunctional 1-(5-phosphoribosyl)-5-((5-phosphoribosylamino)methylideneamino)imidazole-4-carboxamide isomerase/phosphoribosylanthranilate isomerase PriA [Naumannella halotolerans]|uniref:1-(5-phosphoribosyl)-5-[(5-phosphoribosylamino)methylideneamino] imidazole-4-carboxamide isomerase n=1 Tax=Naumannella halotolerans TaxID=993414 RepID=A0A4R7J897_9ACTN|nr:bifunctional 1-(5-phosphoribosyl)-5-((5-phosphoribosylamino)methylideneamino)imidazole-4-carboxamide isomerase/phosphoribosylanthranilate isomerase PriA [Naumannella halotolerans]TDT33515.1 phosphoribosylanthranilate isomerase [Naumannella halotolerans]